MLPIDRCSDNEAITYHYVSYYHHILFFTDIYASSPQPKIFPSHGHVPVLDHWPWNSLPLPVHLTPHLKHTSSLYKIVLDICLLIVILLLAQF
jgi:hypothetical protein